MLELGVLCLLFSAMASIVALALLAGYAMGVGSAAHAYMRLTRGG